MRFNDILDCFNAHITEGQYIAQSSWQRKIGRMKTATTIIYYIKGSEQEEVIRKEYTASISNGCEDILIEETQKRALQDFIKYWNEQYKGTT